LERRASAWKSLPLFLTHKVREPFVTCNGVYTPWYGLALRVHNVGVTLLSRDTLRIPPVAGVCRRVQFLIIIILLGFCSGGLRAAESNATQSSLNDGYSLFYDFCNQESQLSLLLWIKTATPGISDYANRISSTAKDDMVILKKFGVSDSALRLDKISLPAFEVNVRKSMADDRKQQLIWRSSGAAFSQAVSMTQSETINYGMHVAKVLAESEPNPDRARAMRQIYEKWRALHLEAYQLNR
jgi:hypothetical protein